MRRLLFLTVGALLISACTAVQQNDSLTPPPTSASITSAPTESPLTEAPESTRSPAPSPVPTNVRVENAKEYDVGTMFAFDSIMPIYEPEFAPAADAPLRPDELVLGVAFEDEAKAYSISVLRFREMVNDELAGIPILVTW